MSHSRIRCLVPTLLIAAASPLAAYTHIEKGDAPDHQTPQRTANYPLQGQALEAISGTLSPGDPVDAYCIDIVDPAAFLATTNIAFHTLASAGWDTRLYLFEGPHRGGFPIPWMANDDAPGGGFQSLLSDVGPFPGPQEGVVMSPHPGRFILAITGFPDDVLRPGGNPVFDFAAEFTALQAPNAYGGTSLTWENGSANEGTYVIGLAGVVGCGDPVAFVTLEEGSGNLSTWTSANGQSGLAAADAVCQQQADDFGVPGTFRAWASDSSADAYCRVQGLTGKVGDSCGGQSPSTYRGGWVDAQGGLPFLDELPGAGSPLKVHYPVYAALGGALDRDVYTGTLVDGSVDPTATCGDWTGTGLGMVGFSWGGRPSWTSWGALDCTLARRLLCLELTDAPPPAPPGPRGRLAFLTHQAGSGDLSTWAGADGLQGLAAADRVCQNEAAFAGLPFPSTFRAWLSTSTVDASSRLPADGVGWYRLDGVRLGDHSDLTSSYVRAPLNTTTEGAVDSVRVWTGTIDDGTVGIDTCQNWTSESAGVQGSGGFSDLARAHWTSFWFGDCNEQRPIYCFAAYTATIFADGFESGDTTAW